MRIKKYFHLITPLKVICDDQDPPWVESKIKGLIQENNIAKKC